MAPYLRWRRPKPAGGPATWSLEPSAVRWSWYYLHYQARVVWPTDETAHDRHYFSELAPYVSISSVYLLLVIGGGHRSTEAPCPPLRLRSPKTLSPLQLGLDSTLAAQSLQDLFLFADIQGRVVEPLAHRGRLVLPSLSCSQLSGNLPRLCGVVSHRPRLCKRRISWRRGRCLPREWNDVRGTLHWPGGGGDTVVVLVGLQLSVQPLSHSGPARTFPASRGVASHSTSNP